MPTSNAIVSTPGGVLAQTRGNEMNIEYAMKSPHLAFASPETIEKAPLLTVAQKRAILVQWKDQLRQLMIADEESMLRADPKPGANAECLRRVSDAMRRLYC